MVGITKIIKSQISDTNEAPDGVIRISKSPAFISPNLPSPSRNLLFLSFFARWHCFTPIPHFFQFSHLPPFLHPISLIPSTSGASHIQNSCTYSNNGAECPHPLWGQVSHLLKVKKIFLSKMYTHRRLIILVFYYFNPIPQMERW